MKDGMKINDIMDMPYGFMVNLMEEKAQKKEEKSLIAAFTGTGR